MPPTSCTRRNHISRRLGVPFDASEGSNRLRDRCAGSGSWSDDMPLRHKGRPLFQLRHLGGRGRGGQMLGGRSAGRRRMGEEGICGGRGRRGAETGRMWSGCTGRRGTIICNRFMALPVGAEKPTRLSPKFIDFPISRIRKRSSSGHLVNSFPQFHWQQEASCFGGYKYLPLRPLPLPSPSSIRSFLLSFPTTP